MASWSNASTMANDSDANREPHVLRGSASVPKRKRGQNTAYWLFLLPALVLLAGFKAYPTLTGLYYSLTRWSGYGTPHYIGFGNYVRLFHSPNFATILLNNGKLLLTLPVFVFVPLIVAVLLWEKPWGYKFLKAAFFFPAVLSPVVIGGMFGVLLLVSGPVDALLRSVNPTWAPDWLGAPQIAMWSVIGVVLWANFGIGVLIYLSALASVPLEIFDAAKVDGAGWWDTFLSIIVPTLRGIISFWSVILLISLFTTLFGFIDTLTGGGPGVNSTVLEYDVYVQAFSNQQVGYAAAVGVILLAITGILTILQLRMTVGRNESNAS